MRQAARSNRFVPLLLGAALMLALAGPASAQQTGTPADDNSRGVRIIDAPSSAAPEPPPAAAPERPASVAPAPEASPAAPTTATTAPLPPAPPVPGLPELTPAPPAAATLTPVAPSPVAPPVAAPVPQAPASEGVAVLPPRPGPTYRPLTSAELNALSNSIKVANPAELAIDILPGPELALGAKVSLRVTSRKTGYLILVDIDPTGKLTQIYPNPMSLRSSNVSESSNMIQAGKPMQIPNARDSHAAFEFIASPPSGTAMIVALLSDRPVQMIDLPDVPPALVASASAADHLSRLASELRIPDPRNAALQEARWSMAARFYAIR